MSYERERARLRLYGKLGEATAESARGEPVLGHKEFIRRLTQWSA